LLAAGLTPLTLQAKEGLALTNGTTLMAALGSLAVLEAENAAYVADIAGTLSLEALHGTPVAYDPRLQAARPHPRAMECAARLRLLLQAQRARRLRTVVGKAQASWRNWMALSGKMATPPRRSVVWWCATSAMV